MISDNSDAKSMVMVRDLEVAVRQHSVNARVIYWIYRDQSTLARYSLKNDFGDEVVPPFYILLCCAASGRG
jgi:hypothetical protein